MSPDNVIVLVGASDGDLPLLAIGVAITIPLVIFDSALLTSLLDRLPILVYAGAGLLVYIAVEMFFEDAALHNHLEPLANVERLMGLGFAALFVAERGCGPGAPRGRHRRLQSRGRPGRSASVGEAGYPRSLSSIDGRLRSCREPS